MSHPSFFELDAIATGSAPATENEQHVSTCKTCSTYIENHEPAVGVPGWVVPAANTWNWNWKWLVAGGVLATSAAILFLVFANQQQTTIAKLDSRDVTTAKGAGPVIGIYVSRGDHVSLWNGDEPLHSGDTIGIKVLPDGYRHLAILFRSSEQPNWQILHRTELSPDGQTALRPTWELDGNDSHETLAVVFMKTALKDEAVLDTNNQVTPDTWVRRYQLRD